MQTFLPVSDFYESARTLDYRRLGKQRLECKQLLEAIGYGFLPTTAGHAQLVPVPNPKAGWINHPAAKMWKGYHWALASYYNAMVREWKDRGYNNTMPMIDIPQDASVCYPPWLGEPKFHASHRSNLLRKDPKFYGKFGWTEGPDLPYEWPTVPENGPQRAEDF